MKTLKNKLKKQGGFTLVEMLTVVAIIAILIAISIPMVTGALDRAKMATDAANVRAAKACASIKALTETKAFIGANDKPTSLVYDALAGELKKNDATPTKYRKYFATAADNGKEYIYVTVVKNVVYYQWAASAPAITDGDTPGTDWETTVDTTKFE